MSARNLPVTGNFESVMVRMRELADASAQAPLIGHDVQPDEKLLTICAEALEAIKAHEREGQKNRASGWDWGDLPRMHKQRDVERLLRLNATTILKRASKIKAKSAAGIYAKAALIRTSASSAPVLAMSLAIDLLENTTLRASLWPAVVEGSPE